MRRTATTLAAASAIAALGIAGATSAVATPRHHHSAAQLVMVREAGIGTAQVMPRSLVMAAADAGEVARHIHWTRWGSRSALGTATVHVSGTFAAPLNKNYPAHVMLSNVKTLRSGQRLFTKLTVRFDKAVPTGDTRTEVINLG